MTRRSIIILASTINKTLKQRLLFSAFMIGIITVFTLALYYQSVKRARNEVYAVYALQYMREDQKHYLIGPGEKKAYTEDKIRLVATIGTDWVSQNERALPYDLLVQELSHPQHGYLFEVQTTRGTKNSPPTYSIVYFPQKSTGFFRDGDDCFYLDQSGIIRHSSSPTVMADANSPPVR